MQKGSPADNDGFRWEFLITMKRLLYSTLYYSHCRIALVQLSLRRWSRGCWVACKEVDQILTTYNHTFRMMRFDDQIGPEISISTDGSGLKPVNPHPWRQSCKRAHVICTELYNIQSKRLKEATGLSAGLDYRKYRDNLLENEAAGLLSGFWHFPLIEIEEFQVENQMSLFEVAENQTCLLKKWAGLWFPLVDC